MTERAYYCVGCGTTHGATLWNVRQVNQIGLVAMKTDYLCGDAQSRLGPVLRAQWTLLV